MVGHHGEERQGALAVVDKAVGVALGAVVAAPGGEGLVHAVAEHPPRAGEDVDDLAAGLVGVESDGAPGLKDALEDLSQAVGVHPGPEVPLPALEPGEDGLPHLFKFDQHCSLLSLRACARRPDTR